jgi:hypothetical protein
MAAARQLVLCAILVPYEGHTEDGGCRAEFRDEALGADILAGEGVLYAREEGAESTNNQAGLGGYGDGILGVVNVVFVDGGHGACTEVAVQRSIATRLSVGGWGGWSGAGLVGISVLCEVEVEVECRAIAARRGEAQL